MLQENRAVSLLSEKLLSWYELGIKNIPNFIVASVVLLLFVILAKSLKKSLEKILPKVLPNKSLNALIGSILYSSILLIGLFTSLEVLGLEKTVTSLLAGAGVLGLALGFAFQEIASNFVSGVMISLREPYRVGDIVEVENYVGEVKFIELRTTCITTYQGLEVFIPNKDMFTKPFINYTSTPKRRVDIEVGVTYDANLKEVEKVVVEALSSLDGRIQSERVEAFFHSFGDSSINLSARVWIHFASGPAFFEARHKAIILIKDGFDKNNITIPFPIRTLDFDYKKFSSMSKS